MDIRSAAATFMGSKRIAVTGVSRSFAGRRAIRLFQRLQAHGYQVFAVNPDAAEIDGHPVYRDLRSIPGGVDAVVIAEPAERAEVTVREAAALHIGRVWMNGGPRGGSVSSAATAYGRAHGVNVIDGGSPLMFDGVGDLGHKCLRAVLQYVGRVPRQV